MVKQIKQSLINYYRSFNFSLSHLFLAIGFIFFIPFAAFSWKFMVTSDPADVLLKDWMIVTFFVLSFSCYIVYFVFEYKKGSIKNNIFLWAFLLFAILSVVSVLIQPSNIIFDVVKKSEGIKTVQYDNSAKIGDTVTVYVNISPTHKMFFSMGSLLITTTFFFVLIVLPKTISSLRFLLLICSIVAGFALVVIIYSYIFEWDEYPILLKAVFSGDTEYLIDFNICSINSFLVNRVPYGAFLMMSLLFMLLAYHLTHKKVWVFFGIFFYINLFFSWCKTSFLLSTLTLLAYFILLLIITFKIHKRRNIILLIISSVVAISFFTITLISILTKGNFIYQIYAIYRTFIDGKSLNSRINIWGNIRTELEGGWWIIGRGFGTHNTLLYPMNLVNGDNVCPSHSTYYGILGAGGIINLLGFAGMFVYYIYAFVKCWKVDKVKTLGLAFPVLAYFLYSFTECINYLWLAFMFPTILYYNLIKREEQK